MLSEQAQTQKAVCRAIPLHGPPGQEAPPRLSRRRGGDQPPDGNQAPFAGRRTS